MSLPLFWRDEQSGILARAVNAYLSGQTGGELATNADITLVRDYLDQWIHAPCWMISLRIAGENDAELIAEMISLRASVKRLRTADEVHEWLMKALDLGIDPL